MLLSFQVGRPIALSLWLECSVSKMGSLWQIRALTSWLGMKAGRRRGDQGPKMPFMTLSLSPHFDIFPTGFAFLPSFISYPLRS